MTSAPKTLLMHEVPHQRPIDELSRAIKKQDPAIEYIQSQSYNESRELISDAEVVVTRNLHNELLEEAANLQWIQALNAGVDHYNLDEIRERDIILTNASGVHAIPAAEQVIGYLLQFERNLLQGLRQQQRREWQHFDGGELADSTIGIIGVGDIGGVVAERASAFGMQTFGLRRHPEKGHEKIDKMYGPKELHDLLAHSKYVVLACPLTEDTRNLIGPQEFESMRSDSVVINIARGEVINEKSLILALQKGSINGAALDVQQEEPLPDDSPLWTQSNVIITPHMAGATPKYLDRCAEIFIKNYGQYIQDNYDGFVNRII